MKRFLLILLAFMIVLSSGCSGFGEYRSPGNLAKELQSEIMECFVKKDGETLKSFFREYIIENYSDIDEQIKAAFDFLDGEIISYDEPFSSASGSHDKKDYGATTRNIITDQGTEYIIAFKGWLSNDKEPDKVGTTVIVIQNKTMKDRLEEDENASQLFRVCIGETD